MGEQVAENRLDETLGPATQAGQIPPSEEHVPRLRATTPEWNQIRDAGREIRPSSIRSEVWERRCALRPRAPSDIGAGPSPAAEQALVGAAGHGAVRQVQGQHHIDYIEEGGVVRRGPVDVAGRDGQSPDGRDAQVHGAHGCPHGVA